MFLDASVLPLRPASAPHVRGPLAHEPARPGPAGGAGRYRQEGTPKLKRSYLLWEDQAEALVLARSLASIGHRARGAGAHGTEMSEIVRTLLDLHGYDRSFVDGTGAIR